jgi:hypothetical protein
VDLPPEEIVALEAGGELGFGEAGGGHDFIRFVRSR